VRSQVKKIAAPALALGLGAALAVALVSCGGRDEQGLLPGENAQQILANLEQVKSDAAAGDCSSAASEVAAVQEEINSLPASVDSELRSRLEAGARQLADLVNSPGACETTTAATTESTSTETTTTRKPKTTTTSTTSTTTTSTTPTTTTSSSTTVPTNPTGGTGTPGGTPAPPGQGQEGG
jgi:hypothetical protein